MLFICSGAVEGYFEGKTPQEGHQGRLVLVRQYPGSPGTFNPKKLAYLGSQCLITHPILWTWPRRTTTCSLNRKKMKSHHFSSDAEVIAVPDIWLDGKFSEFF